MIIASYGSLRKNFYNHYRFLTGAKFLGESTVRGAMYIVSKSYPFLLSEEESEPDLVREHKVELYEVDDRTYSIIRSMELGAGYRAEDREFQVDGKPVTATIYFFQDNPKGYTWIEEYSKETAPHGYVTG